MKLKDIPEFKPILTELRRIIKKSYMDFEEPEHDVYLMLSNVYARLSKC